MSAQLNGLLRQLLRQREGRDAEPSACVIDAQSVKTSTSVPASSQGTDAGKKIVGRKRSIVTDTTGLLLAVLVTTASVQVSGAGTQLLDQIAAGHPAIRKVWVDGGYRRHFVEHAATLGIGLEVTARTTGTRGFTPIPKAVGGRADLRLVDAPPPPDPRLRNPPQTLRSHDPPRHDRSHGPLPHRREHPLLARPENHHQTACSGIKHWEKTTSQDSASGHL